jgi:hypothetical protein
MNPLHLRLAALRRRLRLVVAFRGTSLVLAILLLAAVATGLLDWRIPGHLPRLVRAFLLVGALSSAGFVAYRRLLRPLWANADDLSLALRVETRYPAFQDALASAVQFLEEPAGSERTGSPSLRREAVERALGQAKGLDFNSVVDARGVRAAGVSLAVAAGLTLAFTLAVPQLAWTAFLRLAHPFGDYEWPRQTRLEITAPSRVAQGAVFEIQGRVRGSIPERARVAFHFENMPSLEQDYEIRHADGSAEGLLSARLEASRVQRHFRFQVRANDAVSAWHAVEVLPPPQLVPLAGRPSPQIALRFPDYTGLPAIDLPDGASSIEAAAGTQICMRAAVDRPLVRAWLEFPAELEPALTTAAVLGALGAGQPSGVFELAAARQRIWKQIPARLEAGGTVLSFDFIARVSGTLALHLEDEMGLGNTRLVELRTLDDPAPLVHLERPSRSRDSLDVLPDAEITLQVLVEDPRYAIRSVSLNHRLVRKRNREAAGVTRRLPLYEEAAVGEALPALLAGLTAWPIVPPLPSLHLRPARLAIDRRWSLRGLGLHEGDTLVLQACADDFDDVTVGKKAGCSQEVEIHIVNRTGLDLLLNEAQAQVQQELLRLHKQQQEALAKVVPAETHWRNQQGPLLPKHLDELLQAEQLQQQIQSRVGNNEEGLRAEVGRILQTLRDNHLPRTGAQDRMNTVAAELERLAREELGPIESQLTEARKQSETRTGQRSAADTEKRPLTEARHHQEEVQKTLSELLKLLEPWSSTREVQGEAKSILQEQRRLAEQTAGLAQEIPLSAERSKLKPAQKAELERTEESQRDLAERAGQLMQKLKRLAGDRANQDPEMAKQLAEAATRGEETEVADKMQKAEQSIRKMQLAKAGTEQADSAKAMEEVVKALEDRRDEDLDRLIKKMKEAEQKLAELAEQQDKLREKVKEAGQIGDAVKREETLKRLAREQERLQRMAQDMVRELSRLRAERASQALGQASSGMQRAGRQMETGDGAEEQHEEVLDRLNDAQQRLQEAREEAEEELAREKLAKLGDQIKGLRERQESLLAESARVHRELLQRQQWVRPLQASLRGLADAQRSLGEETERLAQEKLAGAKVFAHLLAKSAKAMQQASDRMLGRLDKAQERIDNGTAGEETGLDVPAEQAADAETQALQRAAIERIDRLLDALKTDSGGAARPPSEKGGGGQPGGGTGGGGAAGETVPPIAQLKALRALQQEVNERTRTFGKQHPEAAKLTKKEEGELQALRQEQVEIADLFEQLNASPESQGDKK